METHIVNGEVVELSPADVAQRLADQSAAGGVLIQPLTARQLRLGLVTNGFALEQVVTAITAIEDPQERSVAQIEWEYASQFERAHPLIAQVGAALGLTDEQIDAMWQQALAL